MLGVINIPLLTLAPDPVNLGLVAMTLGSDLRGKHNVVHSFSDSYLLYPGLLGPFIVEGIPSR